MSRIVLMLAIGTFLLVKGGDQSVLSILFTALIVPPSFRTDQTSSLLFFAFTFYILLTIDHDVYTLPRLDNPRSFDLINALSPLNDIIIDRYSTIDLSRPLRINQ